VKVAICSGFEGVYHLLLLDAVRGLVEQVHQRVDRAAPVVQTLRRQLLALEVHDTRQTVNSRPHSAFDNEVRKVFFCLVELEV